jgi:hypothetical protein
VNCSEHRACRRGLAPARHGRNVPPRLAPTASASPPPSLLAPAPASGRISRSPTAWSETRLPSVSPPPSPGCRSCYTCQIHAHGPPLSTGTTYVLLPPFRFPRLSRPRFELLAQTCHQFPHHFFGIPLNRLTRLSRVPGSIIVRLRTARIGSNLLAFEVQLLGRITLLWAHPFWCKSRRHAEGTTAALPAIRKPPLFPNPFRPYTL